MKRKGPDIFTYTDHRKFLKDLYRNEKSKSKYFTYRKFSQIVGLVSPSMLKDVIEGRKNITLKKIRQFITPFKFPQRHEDYFVILVNYNLAKNADERRNLFRDLIRLQRNPQSKQIT